MQQFWVLGTSRWVHWRRVRRRESGCSTLELPGNMGRVAFVFRKRSRLSSDFRFTEKLHLQLSVRFMAIGSSGRVSQCMFRSGFEKTFGIT
jgi:hypothetical protein